MKKNNGIVEVVIVAALALLFGVVIGSGVLGDGTTAIEAKQAVSAVVN